MKAFVVTKEMLDAFKVGDPKCTFPIDSRVMKMDSDAEDIHSPGTSGKVTGNLSIVGPNGILMETYLVMFDGTPAETFIMKEKLIAL